MKTIILNFDTNRVFSEADSLSDLMKENPRDLDLVLLDFGAPRHRVSEVEILRAHPSLAARTLAVLDPLCPPQAVDHLFQSAVRGVIKGEEGLEVWEQALGTLFRGGHYFCRRIRAEKSQGSLPAADTPGPHPLEKLSPREIQVFQWIGCGWSTRKIAGRLDRSPKTIETYREHIKEKLGLDDGTSLIRAAGQWVEQGVIDAQTGPSARHANARRGVNRAPSHNR